MTQSIQLLKKIGANQILGKVKNVVNDFCANDGDIIDAYSVYGHVNGVQEGVSQYGKWYAFVGSLGAVNHITGEKFEGAKCFIPEPLQSIVLKGLEDNDNVEFAFTVQLKRRDDLETGYEYLTKPHRELQAADPLEGLRSRIPQIASPKKVTPQLEAPAEDTKPAKGKTK